MFPLSIYILTLGWALPSLPDIHGNRHVDVLAFIVNALTYIISLHPLNNLVGNPEKYCPLFKNEETKSQSYKFSSKITQLWQSEESNPGLLAPGWTSPVCTEFIYKTGGLTESMQESAKDYQCAQDRVLS